MNRNKANIIDEVRLETGLFEPEYISSFSPRDTAPAV